MYNNAEVGVYLEERNTLLAEDEEIKITNYRYFLVVQESRVIASRSKLPKTSKFKTHVDAMDPSKSDISSQQELWSKLNDLVGLIPQLA